MAKAKAKTKKSVVKKKSALKTKVKTKTKTKTKTAAKSDLSNMFVPLDDRVLIERSPEVTKTMSGLFIPDSAAQQQTNKGTVISVGPGHKSIKGHLRPTTVKVGEQILFGKYAGTEIKIGDHEYIILRETDIIGVLEK